MEDKEEEVEKRRRSIVSSVEISGYKVGRVVLQYSRLVSVSKSLYKGLDLSSDSGFLIKTQPALQ